MRVGLGCAVVLLCLACESKLGASAPAVATPDVAPPDVANAELKRFLDGMLVTSKVRPPDESVWPVPPGEGAQLDSVIIKGSKGWGFESTAQIRAYVDV